MKVQVTVIITVVPDVIYSYIINLIDGFPIVRNKALDL